MEELGQPRYQLRSLRLTDIWLDEPEDLTKALRPIFVACATSLRRLKLALPHKYAIVLSVLPLVASNLEELSLSFRHRHYEPAESQLLSILQEQCNNLHTLEISQAYFEHVLVPITQSIPTQIRTLKLSLYSSLPEIPIDPAVVEALQAPSCVKLSALVFYSDDEGFLLRSSSASITQECTRRHIALSVAR